MELVTGFYPWKLKKKQEYQELFIVLRNYSVLDLVACP